MPLSPDVVCYYVDPSGSTRDRSRSRSRDDHRDRDRDRDRERRESPVRAKP